MNVPHSCAARSFFSFYQVLKQSVAEGIDVVVNDAGDAEEHDTCGADEECKAGIVVRTEGGNGRLVGLDVHCLYDEEVVVE